jgi:hypothetical protein
MDGAGPRRFHPAVETAEAVVDLHVAERERLRTVPRAVETGDQTIHVRVKIIPLGKRIAVKHKYVHSILSRSAPRMK